MINSVCVYVKDLPSIGSLSHVADTLKSKKLKEVKMLFQDKIDGLGCSYDDAVRKDVYAFGPNGYISGWKGCYGGSTAALYSNSVAAQANARKVHTDVPPDTAILVITCTHKGSYAWCYVNPCHKNSMLLDTDKLSDKENRILNTFRQLIGSCRKKYLSEIGATDADKQLLADKGYLKINKRGIAQLTPQGKTYADVHRLHDIY